ncbi:hypothetical protein D3C85_1452320 [compost metagenome]
MAPTGHRPTAGGRLALGQEQRARDHDRGLVVDAVGGGVENPLRTGGVGQAKGLFQRLATQQFARRRRDDFLPGIERRDTAVTLLRIGFWCVCAGRHGRDGQRQDTQTEDEFLRQFHQDFPIHGLLLTWPRRAGQ